MAGMSNEGETIREQREARGLSQAALAEAVGTRQQTIDKIERGIIKHSRYSARIATELGLSLGDLMPAATAAGGQRTAIGAPLSGGRDLPVYGSVEGGKGQLIMSHDPVDWVPRPAPLANVQGAYALIYTGESMAPEFEPGDTVLVHPHLPGVRDVSCVIYRDVDGDTWASIKRLVKVTPDAWIVRQWNPAKEFSLARKEWGRCHRIVGKYSSK
jgi:phage repressor protein C with HTH and peptisase S24 domain